MPCRMKLCLILPEVSEGVAEQVASFVPGTCLSGTPCFRLLPLDLDGLRRA